jgi:hypothetical protein
MLQASGISLRLSPARQPCLPPFLAVSGRQNRAWFHHLGPALIMLCKMEMRETANCDSVRCQKFKDCFHTMSWLYRVHMLAAGQPTTTLAALSQLVSTCRNYASTCQVVNSDDFERRIKQHHIDHHLPHAAAWWGRTMMTAENQEGCNPFLRSVYDSSNKCNPVLAIANFCAARINAKFLRLAADSIRTYDAVRSIV